MTESYTPRSGDWVKGTAKSGSGTVVCGEVRTTVGNTLHIDHLGWLIVSSFVWGLAERPVKPLEDGIYKADIFSNFYQRSGGNWYALGATKAPGIHDGYTAWIRYVPAGSGETR